MRTHKDLAPLKCPQCDFRGKCKRWFAVRLGRAVPGVLLVYQELICKSVGSTPKTPCVNIEVGVKDGLTRVCYDGVHPYKISRRFGSIGLK